MEKGIAIETESFQIIDSLTDLSKYTEEEKVLVRKLVHTTGDVEFAELAVISGDAAEKGVQAVRNKKPVICDVTMVTSGITARYLEKTGVEVLCFINHPEVLERAKRENKTRSEVAVEYAVSKYPDAIFAIGNAPTALLKLLELYEAGFAKPSFVAGLPVGFVKAEESKDLLAKTNIPHVTNRGTKGGSPCAATVINGILTLAVR